jgi:hypothetical protein
MIVSREHLQPRRFATNSLRLHGVSYLLKALVTLVLAILDLHYMNAVS